ncbi:MAG: TonB-dependent receptor [Bacteroidetes bacterium]|nr:TonB-dependent receptor [Bacteroidota bacterium]
MRKLYLLLLGVVFFAAQALAQRTVTGKVTDEKGNPLANVSVLVRGTTTGTTTKEDGTYSLTVPANAKALVFSSVDMSPVEQAIGTASVVNATLKAEDRTMSEVVVVGYGTQRRRDVTGSVSRISGDKTKDLPVQSFEQALSGRAAGVSVTLPNGVLNAPPVVRVRGINAMGLSSFPLVVIDGIPTFSGNAGNSAANNVLSDINPGDIESVEVLKDAAAAAIYGSRAAAGVILVTTKEGKQGKARVNYDAWVGFTRPFNLVPLLDAREYELIKNEGLTNAGTPPNGTTRGFYPYIGPDGQPVNTNWYDVVYRQGVSHTHNINVSGANDRTNYFFSAGFTKQKGMIFNNDFKRLTTLMSLEHKVNSRFTVGGKFQYSTSKNSGLNTGSLPGQAFNTSGVGRLAFNLMPNVPVFLNNGAYNINTASNTIGQGGNITALQFTNPKYLLDKNIFTSENDRILANAYGTVKIFDGLQFKMVFGIDNLQVTNKAFQDFLHGDGVGQAGSATNTLQTYRRWNWQNLLTYDKTFGKHTVGVLGGIEEQYTSSDGWGASRQGVTDPFYNEYQGGYNNILPAGNFLGENYLISYIARLNYGYARKYLASVNFRRDGYSAFAPDNKYGNFFGGSLGYVVSEEKFFKNSGLSRVMNLLKFKGSYGEVGNIQGIGDFAFWTSFSSGLYAAAPSIFFSQAGNRDLRWENSKKTDIGVEMGFFRGRLTAEITYYKNIINDGILAEPTAPSRGIPGNSITTNIGSMYNKGWEVTLTGTVVQTKNFTWNSSFNITTLKNVVTRLANQNADIQPATSGLERPSMVRVGESLGVFYVVRTGGVNPANGQRIYYYSNGTAVQYNHAASAVNRWTLVSNGAVAPRVADQASDGVIIGPALPKWQGGFDNTFRYKNFDLNILMFFSGGNYVYNGSKAGQRDMRSWNNMKDMLKRWQKPGDITDIPRVVFGDNISNGSGIVISENVEKGDFLKARNITLGYAAPKNVTDKLGISSIRFYVQMQNAFTFTKYSGFDPEISSNGNGFGNPSVDRNSVPQARTVNIGINLGF